MKRIFLSIAFLFALACSAQQTEAVKLSPENFEQKLKVTPDHIVLDVRTPEEFAEAHLAEAQLIDFYKKDFKTQLAKLSKAKPVFVYCAVGGRSGETLKMLKDMGFKKVYDLKGGINAWVASGKLVVK